MAHGEKGKSKRLNCDWTKARKCIAAPISIEDVMEKEVQSSLHDGAIRELSVLADPLNEDLTHIKRKIRIFDQGSSRKTRDFPRVNRSQHHNGT